MIEIPQKGDRGYLRALGIFALYIAASPARAPCTIGFTRDLDRSLESLRRRHHWSVEITHCWWLKDLDGTRAIVAAVNAAFPTEAKGIDASADEVAARIEAAACSLSIKLTAHADTLRHVKRAAERLDSVIRGANGNGDLGWFNAAYQEWRTSAPANVAKSLPYGRAMARLRAAIVRRLARGEVTPAGVDLLSEVLPVLSAPKVDARPLWWRRPRRSPPGFQ